MDRAWARIQDFTFQEWWLIGIGVGTLMMMFLVLWCTYDNAKLGHRVTALEKAKPTLVRNGLGGSADSRLARVQALRQDAEEVRAEAEHTQVLAPVLPLVSGTGSTAVKKEEPHAVVPVRKPGRHRATGSTGSSAADPPDART